MATPPLTGDEPTHSSAAPTRGEAFASLDQLRRVQRVTDAALANLAVHDLMDELLVRVRDALGADTAAILLLDQTGTELVATAAKGIEEEVEQGVRIPVGRGFAGTVAATRRAVKIPDIDHSNVLNPILREKGIRSLLGVPLIVQGQMLGIIHVGTLRPRDFTDDDAMLLQMVADRVALALHAALYERQRVVAATLQRSFLPEDLTAPVGIELAARYHTASGGEVGGDWYDVFPLPDGTIALAIGDVVGRGLMAARTMAKIRNALRAYALQSSPGEVVRHLNRFMLHLNPDEMATVVYGVVDTVRSTFSFTNAGHMPPLLRGPDGGVSVLEYASAPPLGVTGSETFDEHVAPVPAGTTLVLYTDGLIERRGESLDAGLLRLRQAVDRDLPPDSMCDHVDAILLGESEPTDDVAILVARLAPTGPRIELSLPAEANQLVVIRRALERWLIEQGIDERVMYDVVAASGEAAANVVEHAYGPAGGTVHVTAERIGEAIRLRIRDVGAWREQRSAGRGRGIPMMERLAGTARIVPSSDGTTVDLTWESAR